MSIDVSGRIACPDSARFDEKDWQFEFSEIGSIMMKCVYRSQAEPNIELVAHFDIPGVVDSLAGKTWKPDSIYLPHSLWVSTYKSEGLKKIRVKRKERSK